MRSLGLARVSFGTILFAAPALLHAQAAAKSATKLNGYCNARYRSAGESMSVDQMRLANVPLSPSSTWRSARLSSSGYR